MNQNFHSIIPEIKERIKSECIAETTTDSAEYIAVPYPYVIPGKGTKSALYYWDTYFINIGLIKMKMIDQARHNVENLIFLFRKYGFVPASNIKEMLNIFHPPVLPWMVRDVYRATGDKEWLRRILPDVEEEYRKWTGKEHSSPSGLYCYHKSEQDDHVIASNGVMSLTKGKSDQINPVDLNSLLYRNALLIYDLQIEVEGKGNEQLLQKAEHVKRLMEICWNEEEGFYYDNNFVEKKLDTHKTIAGFMPLFVELVDENRARRISGHIHSFAGPGGLSCQAHSNNGEKPTGVSTKCYAPYIYFTIKGLFDYDIMEDAADIGTNWLQMVLDIYKTTGEFWEWYNVRERSHQNGDGAENRPILGWTIGTYIALIDALGVD
jgi:alpha,alpha-trehalase